MHAWTAPAAGPWSPAASIPATGSWFGLVLVVAATIQLGVTVNDLAAVLALAGFLGYIVVYTVWLKPRTPQNIVIGGAAGAVPPLVGWAAATGGLSWDALYPFAIVFLWTPPHFWALALLIKDDYARARDPDAPGRARDGATRLQILIYTGALVAFSMLPYITGLFDGVYLVGGGLARRRIPRAGGPTLAASLPSCRRRRPPRIAGLPGASVLRDGGGPCRRPLSHGSRLIAMELVLPILFPSLVGVACLAYLAWCVIRARPDISSKPPGPGSHDPRRWRRGPTPRPPRRGPHAPGDRIAARRDAQRIG